MAVKKNKPKSVPRLHEIRINEIVEKGHKAIQSSRERVKKSKFLNEASQRRIEEIRQRKKK